MIGLLLMALSADAPPPAAPLDHGPIPLYQPALESPIDADGSGLRPLVRAKLTIDATGRVSGVTVSAVEPPSPLDEKFREAARAGLSFWRFAPAEKGGLAVASETSVALQFEARAVAAPRGSTTPDTARASAIDADFESRRYADRLRIGMWSAELRKRAADEVSKTAEALIKKDRRATASNDWFEVVTDFGGQKQAEGILNNVNVTYAALYNLLGERVPPRPRASRIRVYAFETNAHYQAFAAKVTPFEWTAGIYHPVGVLAFHTEHPTMSFFLAAMLHETTHAFVDRHLVRSGVELPRWLDEGLADYVANSDIKDRKIVPGGHEKKKDIALGPSGVAFWQSPSRALSEEAQRAQRQKRALRLAEILSASPETFYGQDHDLYYAQGWLAVHFLRHGKPEWAEGAFPKFLLYAAEGYPASDAFRAAYRVDASDLEAAYQKYVKSF